jgi:hypothetical protein
MAENESIGGVRVDIVGDYSRLQGDIDAATQIAAQGGEQIAAGLNAGAAGADALSSAVSAAALGMGSFEDQIAALVASGSTLAEALASVEASSSGIATGVEAAGAAAAVAAEQMTLFDQAIDVPYQDAAGQLNLFATELEPLGANAQQAATGVEALGQAATEAGGHEEELAKSTEHAGEAAHEAEAETAEFLKELLAIAGIGVSIEALKEFAAEAMNLYVAEQRAGEGIAFMRGNIEGAEHAMEELRNTAQALSEPFAAVEHAAQKMAFFKLSAEETEKAMAAASDAAKVSGQSFESMASSISNVALVGNAMPRTLKNIGVSLEDLAAVMEVSADEVKKTFREMAEPARLEALIGAMNRTRGATEAMSNDMTSQLTRLKNTWEFAMTDMGGAIAPLAMEAIPTLIVAMKGLINVAVTIVTAFKVIGDTVAGLASAALEALSGLGTAMVQVFAGRFAAAQQTAVDTLANLRAVDKVTWDSIAADAKAGGDILDKVWKDQEKSAKSAGDAEAAAGVAAAAAAAKLAAARLASAAEYKKEMKEVEDFGKSIGSVLDIASNSYEDYLATLYDGGKKASTVLSALTQDITKGEIEAEKMSGAPKAAMLEFVESLKKARETMRDFAGQDEMAKAWDVILEQRRANAKKVEEEAAKIDAAIVADHQKAALMIEQGELTHQVKLLDIERSAAAERYRLHEITAFERIAIDERVNAREIELAQQALRNELDILEQSTIAQTDYESKREAILLKIQALNDKINGQKQLDAIKAQTEAYSVLGLVSEKALSTQIREADQALKILQDQGAAIGLIYAGEEKELALRIKRAELTGASATAEIIGLEHIRLEQQALYDSTHALGDMTVAIERDIIKGWDMVGNAIVDDIFEGKNFLESMEQVGKQVAKMIMTELVGTAFKALKDSIVGVGSAVKDVKSNFEALHKAVSDLVGGGGADAAKGVGGAAKGLGGGGGGALGMVDAIAGVGSLISNIISNVQFMHMNDSLKVIVNHTLVAANELTNLRADLWSQYNGMYERVGEIWRDMRDGFQAVVDNIGGAGLQAATDAEATRSIFRGGMQDLAAAVDRGKGDAAAASPSQPAGDFNPYTGVAGDIWHGLTHANPNAPTFSSMPDLPSSPSMATPSNATYSSTTSSNSSGNIGSVQFNIYGAVDPRETTRQVADTLKIISPRFSVFAV